MTREEIEEAIEYIKKYRELDAKLYQTAPFNTVSKNALSKCLRYWDMAINSLKQAPSREFEDYENEIEGLQNRLDIAEYDKERLREEVTSLEEKINALEQETCEDCISRKDIQDYIAKYLSQYLYNDIREAIEDIDVYIGDMPSVQPKTDILDKIRAEIHGTAVMKADGEWYLNEKWIIRIIDKYSIQGK